MRRISTHVLDTSRGRPAAGIPVELYRGLFPMKTTATNADGRTDEPLVGAPKLEAGDYDLIFHVGDYFRALGDESFYETIVVKFNVVNVDESYHVPLLLAPYGYSTYRGS